MSWLLSTKKCATIKMLITNNHRVGTEERRKGTVDICEHIYIPHLRGSKLLSHEILFSNPEIADIISS